MTNTESGHYSIYGQMYRCPGMVRGLNKASWSDADVGPKARTCWDLSALQARLKSVTLNFTVFIQNSWGTLCTWVGSWSHPPTQRPRSGVGLRSGQRLRSWPDFDPTPADPPVSRENSWSHAQWWPLPLVHEMSPTRLWRSCSGERTWQKMNITIYLCLVRPEYAYVYAEIRAKQWAKGNLSMACPASFSGTVIALPGGGGGAYIREAYNILVQLLFKLVPRKYKICIKCKMYMVTFHFSIIFWIRSQSVEAFNILGNCSNSPKKIQNLYKMHNLYGYLPFFNYFLDWKPKCHSIECHIQHSVY